MKNFLVANLSSKNTTKHKDIKLMLKAQIENSLELGWTTKNIILLTNFTFEYMGVKANKEDIYDKCLTGSKMFGIKWLFDNNLVNDVIWSHDLDAWQNTEFKAPDFKDVGITCYSTTKYNGGSIFWRKTAKDIVYKITEKIIKNTEEKEEPTLNKILKSNKYNHRVTNINNTFNVGCSGYIIRWQRSIKPICVCHFHPNNNTAWETHALDRNGLDEKGIDDRLEKLIKRYYPKLATKLSEKGKKAQQERKERRLKGLEIKPRKDKKK